VITVLADTGPLYALVDPDDQYHERAHTELEKLHRQRLVLAASWSTVTEAYTLVLQRLSVSAAHPWLGELTEGLGLLNPSREDYLEAAARLRRYQDQDISLFDGILAVLSGRLGLQVWTFDYHFDVMGVSVWR
jgi:predicted nucleic acid-binding protein